MSERYQNFDTMMERYKDEMLRYYQNRRELPARAVERAEMPQIETKPTWEHEKTGLPEDSTARSDSATEGEAPEDDSGYMRVEVSTARAAVPIANADVTISRASHDDLKNRMEIIRLQSTDSSGHTGAVKLPTVDRELSEAPGTPHPFSTYYVSVKADNYEKVKNMPVDIFGGEVSLVPVEMIPMPKKPSFPMPTEGAR